MTKFAVAKLQSCSKSFLHWCESDRTEFCGYLADTRSFASPAIMVIGPIVMSTSLFLFRANHTFKSPLLSSLHCFQLNRHNSQAHTYNYGAMYVHCVTIRHPIWVKALLEATRCNKTTSYKGHFFPIICMLVPASDASDASLPVHLVLRCRCRQWGICGKDARAESSLQVQTYACWRGSSSPACH